MLPERHRQLLTACVDGELGPRQRRLVRRLVRRSPEARRLLRELEQDARALRSLPPVHLDTDLSPYFLRNLARARGLY
jgi:anti-sigma factor RsiW